MYRIKRTKAQIELSARRGEGWQGNVSRWGMFLMFGWGMPQNETQNKSGGGRLAYA